MFAVVNSVNYLNNEFMSNRNTNAHIPEQLILTNANGGFSTIDTCDISEEARKHLTVLKESGYDSLNRIAKQLIEIILYEHDPEVVNPEHVKIYQKMIKTCQKLVDEGY